MEMKDYNLTCGEVIDNLLMLADAYEKASAGKAPNGFAFNPTGAAANMKNIVGGDPITIDRKYMEPIRD